MDTLREDEYDDLNASSLNLDELLGEITPNLVTPHLAKIGACTSKQRPRAIAELIMHGMVQGLKDPIAKDILHDGQIHTVRYVNVEALSTGPWANISLMLLNLSYGEQSTLIESLYPEKLQLAAKTFAVIFTPELRQPTINIQQDPAVLEGLESANAGIAMILSIVKSIGTIPHADEITRNQSDMTRLVHTLREREGYRNNMQRAQQAAKHNDGMQR